MDSKKSKLRYVFMITLAGNTSLYANDSESIIDDLGTAVVIGSSVENYGQDYGLSRIGAIDYITRSELSYEHPNDTLELFSKVPGVNIARYNQGIINTDIGIRGFGTDGVTPHAKLLIDGIPFNLHNGYNELDQMFPMAIGGIETFKGTSDVRYGLYNVAGSYNVYSRTDIGSEVQTTIDSFGSYEIQAYSGLTSGKLTHNYFLGFRDGKGYRDHSDIEKYSFSGRWAYAVDDTFTIGLSTRYSEYEGDSPGYLDRAAARTNPESSALFASQDGGDKEVGHISVFANKQFSDNISFSARAYHNNINRNRFVRFSAGGGLRNRIEDQQISGFIAELNTSVTDTFRVKAGIDYEQQDIKDQRFNAIVDAGSPTGFSRAPNFASVRRNWEHDLQTIGGYIGVEHDATSAFSWGAGVRIDSLEGDFTDLRSSTSSEIRDFDLILQPKFNLSYVATDQVTLFANYGRTFQAPLGSALYQTNATNYDVNINDGGEIGLTYHINDNSNFRFSLWNQVAKNEYQADQINFTGHRQIGKVNRQGLELAFNYHASEKLHFWGNVAYSESKIKESSAAFPGTVGNEVRGTPNYTYSAGVAYAITPELTTRLTLDGQSGYFINENNLGGRFGDYTVLNLGLEYKASFGTLALQVNNLTDEHYEYVYDFSSNGTASIHSPGDGVNAVLSYSIDF